MKKIFKKLKYTLALTAVVLSFNLVFLAPQAPAASLFPGATQEACRGSQLDKNASADCTQDDSNALRGTIHRVINLVSVVVGIISVLMIIIGGFRYIVSNGDSGKITNARNTIIYALVGLILVAMAQVIVRFALSNI